MDKASAPSPNTFTETTVLSLSKEDIGKFVGAKGSLIRKHVVNRARDVHAKSSGVTFTDVSAPHVTIKHLPEDDVVVAECSASSAGLLTEVMNCITKHMEHVTKPRAVKSVAAARPSTTRPQQEHNNINTASAQRHPERVCHLNFKTHLPDHLVGKYIGSRGKNCKALAAELGTLTQKIGASSFRVRVVQPDIYSEQRLPSKFFLIKNQDGEEVYIHVSAKFSGNPRDLFRAIKQRMIESVTSLGPLQQSNPEALDFLATVETPFNPSLTNPFGALAAAAAGGDAQQDPGETAPLSPTYAPPSDDEDNN